LSHRHRHHRHKRHVLLWVMLDIIVIVAALGAGVLFMREMGRRSLQSDEIPVMDSRQAETVDEEVKKKLELIEDVDVIVDGVGYRYRKELINIVLAGVDRDNVDSEGRHQCDLVMLAVVDIQNDKVSLIAIPRDTMTDIDFYTESGEYLYSRESQIALAYGYGTNDLMCGELVKKAVSNLFYQLPVQGQFTLFMDGVAMLNDAVGGVTVTLDEPMRLNGTQYYEEDTVTLQGSEALSYVKTRDTRDPDSSLKRLARQKKYMKSFVSAAKNSLTDLTKVSELIETISEYSATDIDFNSMVYLASQAVRMSIGDIVTLNGTAENDGRHLQYRIDEDEFYNLVLNTFYEPVIYISDSE